MVEAEEIIRHLSSKGFDCQKVVVEDHDAITVQLDIAGVQVELIHLLTPEILSLPEFLLSKPNDFGHLAHVMSSKVGDIELGSVCVNDRDSVSVNFNMPLLAIEESLNRHIAILTKAISDPEWNRQELLREFQSCWLSICDYKDRPILLTSLNGDLEEIDVYRPKSDSNIGINSYYLAQTRDTDLSKLAQLHLQGTSKRSVAGKAIVLPLAVLNVAPLRKDEIQDWYLTALSNLQPNVLKQLREQFGRWKTQQYWIVFNAEVPSGKVWFCLSFQSKNRKKHSIPLTEQNLVHWKVKAVPIRLFNKEAVLPRGGANLDLATSNVALIGAGSVGCEIAHKLSAAGIQNLDIYDPDIYSIENLYRHVLPEQFLHWPKSLGLCYYLKSQFLWSRANSHIDKLLELRNRQTLIAYDLIVIAIGSPTHERLFKEYLLDKDVNVPVINTWLEGFGVGGHAVLDIPESKGCLLCSYVCSDTLARGLSSNLNFIEPNQNVTVNLSGCGEQFISYGAVCSAQTALIASDLAIKYLEGKIETSSKVSWKGSEHGANEKGITLTNRFYQFNDSLLMKPLLHEDCDACN